MLRNHVRQEVAGGGGARIREVNLCTQSVIDITQSENLSDHGELTGVVYIANFKLTVQGVIESTKLKPVGVIDTGKSDFAESLTRRSPNT